MKVCPKSSCPSQPWPQYNVKSQTRESVCCFMAQSESPCGAMCIVLCVLETNNANNRANQKEQRGNVQNQLQWGTRHTLVTNSLCKKLDTSCLVKGKLKVGWCREKWIQHFIFCWTPAWNQHRHLSPLEGTEIVIHAAECGGSLCSWQQCQSRKACDTKTEMEKILPSTHWLFIGSQEGKESKIP